MGLGAGTREEESGSIKATDLGEVLISSPT